MSLPDKDIHPNFSEIESQLGEGQLGVTHLVKRGDFLDPESFAGIEEMIPELASSFRGFAQEIAVTGLVVTDQNDEISLGVIQNIPEDQVAKARITLYGINLWRLGVGSPWIDMKGKPFEEVEAAIRQELVGNKDITLLGIFRFID